MLEYLGFARDTVSLAGELRELIRASSWSDDPDLRHSLRELKGDAIELTDKLSDRLGKLLLAYKGLNIDVTIPEQYAAAQFRAKSSLFQKIQLNRFTRELQNIQEELLIFVTDIEALYTCAGKQHILNESTFLPQELRKNMYRMSIDDASVHSQFEHMMDMVHQISKEIRSL